MAHFGDNVVSFFKQASIKLEEFQLQSALGKAELEDKFEELKKTVARTIPTIKIRS